MEKQFTKYLNGTTNPEEFSSVMEGLCAEKTADKIELELLNFWDQNLQSSFNPKENRGLLDKIHHVIALEETQSLSRRYTIYRNLLKVAAILILGLLVTTFTFYQSRNQAESAVFETVSTPFGARTSFKLPDGSEVWLNSGSAITFPLQYGAIRRVELKGEAMFKVAKTGKSFVVETSSGKVEVKGTTFDVSAYEGENFETTLVEGSVRVSNKSNEVIDLKPGQRSVISLNEKITVAKVDPALITSWTQGKLVFNKEPFVQVASELERWYNVKIELQG